MPTITVQDEPAKDPRALSMDEWKAKFHAIVELARSRANRYPPGFEADIRREAMYPDDSGPLACPTQSVVTERSM